MRQSFRSVDDYISSFSGETHEILKKVRSAIKLAAPDAVEEISYGMPGYKYKGRPLVYFAGYDKHIGFYATPSGHTEFAEELSEYKQGKGSVRFPLDKPIPYDLISRITQFRVKENSAYSG